jgi:hypothetical protein
VEAKKYAKMKNLQLTVKREWEGNVKSCTIPEDVQKHSLNGIFGQRTRTYTVKEWPLTNHKFTGIKHTQINYNWLVPNLTAPLIFVILVQCGSGYH